MAGRLVRADGRAGVVDRLGAEGRACVGRVGVEGRFTAGRLGGVDGRFTAGRFVGVEGLDCVGRLGVEGCAVPARLPAFGRLPMVPVVLGLVRVLERFASSHPPLPRLDQSPSSSRL